MLNENCSDDVQDSMKTAQKALFTIVEHIDTNFRKCFNQASHQTDEIYKVNDEDGPVDDFSWFINHSNMTIILWFLFSNKIYFFFFFVLIFFKKHKKSFNSCINCCCSTSLLYCYWLAMCVCCRWTFTTIELVVARSFNESYHVAGKRRWFVSKNCARYHRTTDSFVEKENQNECDSFIFKFGLFFSVEWLRKAL